MKIESRSIPTRPPQEERLKTALLARAQTRLGLIHETCYKCPCLFHNCAGKTDELNLWAVEVDKYFPGEPLCGPHQELDNT
jgi:hypothetical protein